MVLERVAEFLRQLLDRNDQLLHHQNHLKEGNLAMSTDLKTIIAKLNDQSSKIDAQGAQIDKLIADRDAKEQSDLDQISALLDANGAKSDANAAKVAAALLPPDAPITGQVPTAEPGAPISAVVTAPTEAGATTIPVAQVVVSDVASAVDAANAAGTTVSASGPAIADGTTVTSVDPVASTVTLSQPTVDDHVGDGTESLVITHAAMA